MIQGRRYDTNLLVSWKFEGLRPDGIWETLHSCDNCKFSISETRIYPINRKKTYSAFNLSMTNKDSSSDWALCINQIEVYGKIFKNPGGRIALNSIMPCKKHTSLTLFIFMLIISYSSY